MVRKISTNDGQCLLFNLHIDTSGGSSCDLSEFGSPRFPDTHSKLLFRMSSSFPSHLIKPAIEKGYSVSNEARFFGYKAGYEGIVDFFDIGTRASNLR